MTKQSQGKKIFPEPHWSFWFENLKYLFFKYNWLSVYRLWHTLLSKTIAFRFDLTRSLFQVSLISLPHKFSLSINCKLSFNNFLYLLLSLGLSHLLYLYLILSISLSLSHSLYLTFLSHSLSISLALYLTFSISLSYWQRAH